MLFSYEVIQYALLSVFTIIFFNEILFSGSQHHTLKDLSCPPHFGLSTTMQKALYSVKWFRFSCRFIFHSNAHVSGAVRYTNVSYSYTVIVIGFSQKLVVFQIISKYRNFFYSKLGNKFDAFPKKYYFCYCDTAFDCFH